MEFEAPAPVAAAGGLELGKRVQRECLGFGTEVAFGANNNQGARQIDH